MSEEKAVYETVKPVTDLSPKVVRLARAIDRLPPGVHGILLEKPTDGGSWVVSINGIKLERTMEI